MRYYQCDQCGMVIGEGAKWDTHAPGCTGGAMHEVITVRVGTIEWAAAMVATGHAVELEDWPHGQQIDDLADLEKVRACLPDGWSLYEPKPPPWQPKEGDEVRWQCGKYSGTGVYHQLASSGRHLVKVRAGGPWFGVTSVSPLEEGCTLLLERHPPSELPPVVGKRYLVGWRSGTMQTVTTPERRWPDGIVWWAEMPREENDG